MTLCPLIIRDADKNTVILRFLPDTKNTDFLPSLRLEYISRIMNEPAEKSSETSEMAQSTGKANSIEEVDQMLSLNKERVNVAACKVAQKRFHCSN